MGGSGTMRYCTVCLSPLQEDDPGVLAEHLESHAEEMAVAREWHGLQTLESNSGAVGAYDADWRRVIRNMQDERFGDDESVQAQEGVRMLLELLPGMALIPFGSWVVGTAERGTSDVDLSIVAVNQLTVHITGVARSAFKLVVGKRGQRRQELERRSKAIIYVPREDDPLNYIIVTGETPTSLFATVEDIKALLPAQDAEKVQVHGPFPAKASEEKTLLKRACNRLQEAVYLPDAGKPLELLLAAKVPVLRLSWSGLPTKDNTLRCDGADQAAAWAEHLRLDVYFPHHPAARHPEHPLRVYLLEGVAVPQHRMLRRNGYGHASATLQALQFLNDVNLGFGLDAAKYSLGRASPQEAEEMFGDDPARVAAGDGVEYIECADAATRSLVSRILVAGDEILADQSAAADGEITCATPLGTVLCLRLMGALANTPRLRQLVPVAPLLMLPECLGTAWDITARPHLGPRNSALLREILSTAGEDAFVASCVLKRWGKAHGVSDSRSGYLSSYALLLMFVFYLQQAGKGAYVDPSSIAAEGLANMCRPPRRLTPEEEDTCRDMLLGFFDYYKEFDWEARAVTLSAPSDAVVAPAELGYTPAATMATLDKHRKEHINCEMVVFDPYEDVNTARRISRPKLIYLRGLFTLTHFLLTHSASLPKRLRAVDGVYIEKVLESPAPHARLPDPLRAIKEVQHAVLQWRDLPRHRLFVPPLPEPLPERPIQPVVKPAPKAAALPAAAAAAPAGQRPATNAAGPHPAQAGVPAQQVGLRQRVAAAPQPVPFGQMPYSAYGSVPQVAAPVQQKPAGQPQTQHAYPTAAASLPVTQYSVVGQPPPQGVPATGPASAQNTAAFPWAQYPPQVGQPSAAPAQPPRYPVMLAQAQAPAPAQPGAPQVLLAPQQVPQGAIAQGPNGQGMYVYLVGGAMQGVPNVPAGMYGQYLAQPPQQQQTQPQPQQMAQPQSMPQQQPQAIPQPQAMPQQQTMLQQPQAMPQQQAMPQAQAPQQLMSYAAPGGQFPAMPQQQQQQPQMQQQQQQQPQMQQQQQQMQLQQQQIQPLAAPAQAPPQPARRSPAPIAMGDGADVADVRSEEDVADGIPPRQDTTYSMDFGGLGPRQDTAFSDLSVGDSAVDAPRGWVPGRYVPQPFWQPPPAPPEGAPPPAGSPPHPNPYQPAPQAPTSPGLFTDGLPPRQESDHLLTLPQGLPPRQGSDYPPAAHGSFPARQESDYLTSAMPPRQGSDYPPAAGGMPSRQESDYLTGAFGAFPPRQESDYLTGGPSPQPQMPGGLPPRQGSDYPSMPAASSVPPRQESDYLAAFGGFPPRQESDFMSGAPPPVQAQMPGMPTANMPPRQGSDYPLQPAGGMPPRQESDYMTGAFGAFPPRQESDYLTGGPSPQPQMPGGLPPRQGSDYPLGLQVVGVPPPRQ